MLEVDEVFVQDEAGGAGMGGGLCGEVGVDEHDTGEGRAAPKCFLDGGSQTRSRVHGGDFVVAGPTGGVGRVKKSMKAWCEVKVRAVLGRDAGDDKDIAVLGQAVRWTKEGVELRSTAS